MLELSPGISPATPPHRAAPFVERACMWWHPITKSVLGMIDCIEQ